MITKNIHCVKCVPHELSPAINVFFIFLFSAFCDAWLGRFWRNCYAQIANNLPSAPLSYANQPISPGLLFSCHTPHQYVPCPNSPRARYWTPRDHSYSPEQATVVPKGQSQACSSLSTLPHPLLPVQSTVRLWASLPLSFCVHTHLVLPHVALHGMKCPRSLGVQSHKPLCQDIVSGSVILPDLKNAILGTCQDTLQPCEVGEMGILMYPPHS